jgi:hypothetical protein
MFYGDYANEVAKQKIDGALRACEHDRLVKELRTARKGTRSGLVVRTTALIVSLFG